MPLQQFTDGQIQARAEELGLVEQGQALPLAKRSRVVAALIEEQRATASKEQQAKPVCAKEIVVQPGGQVLVDGEPFPWLIAKQPMEISLDANPEGISTVRMTLLTEAVQILKPTSDSKESE